MKWHQTFHPTILSDELTKLAVKAKTNKLAEQKLYTYFEPIIYNNILIYWQLKYTHTYFDDLMQTGFVALGEAIEKFTTKKGNKKFGAFFNLVLSWRLKDFAEIQLYQVRVPYYSRRKEGIKSPSMISYDQIVAEDSHDNLEYDHSFANMCYDDLGIEDFQDNDLRNELKKMAKKRFNESDFAVWKAWYIDGWSYSRCKKNLNNVDGLLYGKKHHTFVNFFMDSREKV
jgi:hypothetical protein